MGGMGGNAETKRKAEVEAEAKAEESPFFDPPADGKMTAEQRQAVLTAKLKELGDYGVKRRTVEESPFFDPPAEIELERSTPAHPPEKADEPKEEVILAAPPVPVHRKAKRPRLRYSCSVRALSLSRSQTSSPVR